MLGIESFTLGPAETNTYLIADTNTGEAAVVDPAWDGSVIVKAAEKRGWRIGQIWLTHAHFDHFAGAAEIVKALEPPPTLALHPEDLPLLHVLGGAPLFGVRIEQPPEPAVSLSHGQVLSLGAYQFEVRHTPGHSPGHVIFYCQAEKLVFCGDVVVYGSVGRVDLPGGNYKTLIDSIRSQILSLPDDTRLLTGHWLETSVGRERSRNPFLR